MTDFSALFGTPDGSQPAHPLSFRVFPPKGPARWLLEADFKRPWHLRTWPQANRRARMIFWALWRLSYIKVNQPAGAKDITVAHDSLYAALRQEFDHLAVFTGTPGPNRKYVIFAQNKDRSVFVKVPFGLNSARLIAHERTTFNVLSADPDIAPLLPAHFDIAGHLGLEDITTHGARYAPLPLVEVRRVCDLLARRSMMAGSLSDQLALWQTCPSGVPADHSKTDRAAIAAARNAAQRFVTNLPRDMTVDSYNAHGDFTRWNVLKSRDGTARVLDWEMYGPKPLWFDLIHYYVSHGILVRKMPPDRILQRLLRIGAQLNMGGTWPVSLGLYFVVQSLTYCAIYERQPDLHTQARTQLRVWRHILDRLCNMQDTADVPAIGPMQAIQS